MDNLSDIIKRRSTPGVLIFDMAGSLLYANREALEMIPGLGKAIEEGEYVPKEICRLCSRLKNGIGAPDAVRAGDPDCPVLEGSDGLPCSLRAFFLGNPGGGGSPTHIIVLVERIIERHEVDFERARREFDLSNKELEVLRLICRGLTNREIAERMFICEYTVKDHIKKIMKKMKAGSRGEIVALLK